MDADGPHLIARGQFFLLVLLALCIALHPGIVLKRNESGMSTYGAHLKTAIPYTLAFIVAACYTVRASRHIGDDRRARGFRTVLWGYGVALILVAVSTYGYRLNATLNDFHVVVNAVTAIFETGGALWMFRAAGTHRTVAVPLLIELMGATVIASTTTDSVHLLFLGEVLIGAGFGVMLIQTSRQLVAGFDVDLASPRTR